MNTHPLAAIFPPLPDAELQELAADIKDNGLREAITVYEDAILDGRNRYAACGIAGVEPRYKKLPEPYASRGYEGAAAYVWSCNGARRDLEKSQRAAIRLKLTELVDRYRAEAKDAQVRKPVDSVSPPGDEQTTPSRDVSTRIASDTGTGRSTVARIQRVKREDPALFERIVDGEVTARRAERIVRDRVAAAKRGEREKRESGISDAFPPDVRCGDFREVLADVRDVDLVFTDPPYPREFLPLWSDLGAWAARALKPGALLVAYSGHYHLPEVLARLGESLEYVWLGWVDATGPQASVHQRPVMTGGKPLLFFSNGPLAEPYRSRRFYDTVSSEYARDLAETGGGTRWAQSDAPAVRYIEALTERGELIADPFLGSGTFGRAAYTLLRRFVGAEIDAAVYEQALVRVNLQVGTGS